MFQPPFLRSGNRLLDEWVKKLSRKLQTEFETFLASNDTGGAIAEGIIVDQVNGGGARSVVTVDDTAGLADDWVGVTTQSIADGATGIVRYSGIAKVAFEAALNPANGDLVYLSNATAGIATNVAPAHEVRIGTIVDASSYGTDQTCMVELRYCCFVPEQG